MSILDWLVLQRTKSFRVRPSNVWFDDDCRTAKRLTRLKERRYKSTGQLVDKTAWILQLCSYHWICDFKHSLFWKCQISCNSKNTKNLWNQINNVLGRTKGITQSIHSADTFSDFFQDKDDRTRSALCRRRIVRVPESGSLNCTGCRWGSTKASNVITEQPVISRSSSNLALQKDWRPCCTISCCII